MQVHVRAYGHLRERVGRGRVIDLAEAGTLADLLAALEVPSNRLWITRVNGTDAPLDQTLHEGDRVELVAPVAGG